jgi:hypothetical protein
LLKHNNQIKGIDVEVDLSPNERAILSASVKQEGFDVIQRLMEDQVRKFNLRLINTDPSEREKVLANHRLAKAVAQFYVGLMDKISEICEIEAYNNRPRTPRADLNLPNEFLAPEDTD